MKHIIQARSNVIYQQKEGNKFELTPSLELVIIHTDGKNYQVKKDGIGATPKVSEARFLVTDELLTSLIAELTLQQGKMRDAVHNAAQINSLVDRSKRSYETP